MGDQRDHKPERGMWDFLGDPGTWALLFFVILPVLGFILNATS